MKRAAILDLGTNTFNLLIVEFVSNTNYKILINRKLAVKLGEGRINDGEIIPAAFERGISAVLEHSNWIKKFEVQTVKAFGTSALRSAKNGHFFLQKVQKITGVEIEIISGDREAELIYKGVNQTLPPNIQKFLILDIGGGSNELILADKNNIFWKKSYPLGMARLLQMFNPSDPITTDEIRLINHFLSENMKDLKSILEQYQIGTLVGASGSFETFVSMINDIEVEETEGALEIQSTIISIDEFNKLYEMLIHSTFEERKKMKGLESMRIEMIVLASIFVKFMLDNHLFDKIIQTNFSLKEGAAFELIKETV